MTDFQFLQFLRTCLSSVPDRPDPHVFGPPGSGSISQQRYGYGSGSFCHQAKIVRKTLIPTVL